MTDSTTGQGESGAKKPDPIDEVAGAIVRRVRKRGGISQESLADSAGVSFQQVQKYENASNRLSFSRMFKVAAALGMKPSEFVKLVEDELEASDRVGDTATAVPVLGHEGYEFGLMLERLPSENVRQRFRELLKAMQPEPEERRG